MNKHRAAPDANLAKFPRVFADGPALAWPTIPGGLIHHSDRGVQYACGDYLARLEAHGLQRSMSRAGCPYDNAMAESFMKTLKAEEVDGSDYRDLADAQTRIGLFIEAVYNRQRLHSALRYLSPEEYEANPEGLIHKIHSPVSRVPQPTATVAY